MLTSRSTGLIDVGPGVKAEMGTVVFGGREFTSGGAFLSDSHAVGYLKADKEGGLYLATWEGRPMAKAVVISSWATPRSYVSSRMFQVEATINGQLFTGRTGGCEMLWRGRPKRGGESPVSYIQRQALDVQLGIKPPDAPARSDTSRNDMGM